MATPAGAGPISPEDLTIVPANQASWADLSAIFGTVDPGRCNCQRYKTRGWFSCRAAEISRSEVSGSRRPTSAPGRAARAGQLRRPGGDEHHRPRRLPRRTRKRDRHPGRLGRRRAAHRVPAPAGPAHRVARPPDEDKQDDSRLVGDLHRRAQGLPQARPLLRPGGRHHPATRRRTAPGRSRPTPCAPSRARRSPGASCTSAPSRRTPTRASARSAARACAAW